MVGRNAGSSHRPIASIAIADLAIDALHRNVRQGTDDVLLSPQEHVLLYVLAARAGRAVSYSEIAESLGQSDTDVRRNSLARHISGLRRKLGDDAHHPRYIESVLGIGYRFIAIAPRLSS
jgi:DNA-binding response OmpR family regulator